MDHEAASEIARTATHGPGDPPGCVPHNPSLDDVELAAKAHGIEAFFEPTCARIILRKVLRDGRFAAAYIQSDRPSHKSEARQIEDDIKNFTEVCGLIEHKEG